MSPAYWVFLVMAVTILFNVLKAFSQRKFAARHRRQPPPFLLLRSSKRDRTHRQAAVNVEEGRD